MKELVENVKSELLGKEVSLLDLDNKVRSITGSTTSLFDYDFDCVKASCSYYISYNNDTDMSEEILVEYDIIKDDENDEYKTETIVKVTNVSEL